MLYLLFHPRSSFLVANRSKVKTDGIKRIALTFDDGPNPQHTPALIRILKAKNVNATFFLVGLQAVKYPELVRLLVAEGNQVANHTHSHPPLFCFLSPRRLREEVEGGQRALQQVCGRKPLHFRSPLGLRHPLLQKCLMQAGLEYISWRVRAFDTWKRDSDVLTQKIVENTAPGDIILLHDKPGEATRRMLDALPGIIDRLKNRGYEFVLV
jgi:peptidoglycan/xylan/chitin deacetylase (PgdA/CDA1 family)